LGQASLPLSRTTWNASAPAGWTDSGTGSYTSSFACTGDNSGKLDDSGDYYQVNFDSQPGEMIFKLKSASMSGESKLTVEESTDGSSWTSIGNYGTCASCIAITDCNDISLTLNSSSRYVKWTYTKVNGNCVFDDVSIASGGSTPLITVTPTILTGFTYVEGSGPSDEQSFTISGENLTADISIAATTNYEISTGTGGSFSATNPIELTQTGGTVAEETIYVRLKAGLSVGDFNNEDIIASSTDATNKTVTCSGSVAAPPDPEPSNHVTSFTATANGHNQIDLTWNDNDGAQAADGFLIVGKTGAGSFYAPDDGTDPADDTDWSDNNFNVKVAHGVGSYSVTGLDAETTYDFKIYPYTNSGSNIDYKTDGTVPTANAETDELTAGLQLTAANTVYLIDFENTVAGVNNGQFNGSGFTPTPGAGQLNSDAWAMTGMSDGALDFGGIKTSGDFARGTSTGGVTTGGTYAFEVSTGNYALGVQPGSSDWASGALTLRLQNQTGVEVSSLTIGYKVYIYNDQARSNNFNFSYSDDDDTYTDIPALDLISTEVADGSPSWKSYYRIIKLSGLSLVDNGLFYLRWSGADFGGSGSRDEFALDDISIVANPTAALAIQGSYEELVVGANTEIVIEAGNTLSIDGTLTNNAGSLLVLQSPESNNAAGSLIVDTYSGTGEIRAERYISGYTTSEDGWHLFASPVNIFVVAGSDFEPSSVLNEEDDLYYWDEAQSSAGLWMNYKEGAFNFEAGKGYLLAFKNNGKRNIQGIPHNTDVALSNLSYTNPSEGSTYHLLGNHFTSALTWTAANWNRTAIGGVAKVMNVSNGSYIDINDGGVIPAMQGFFVEVTNGTNAITIPKAAQSHSAQTWYKSTSTEKIILQATEIENDLSQQNVIILNPESDGSYKSEYDGRFLPLYAPELYTMKGSKKLSTSTLPVPDENSSIPVYFETNGAFQFNIELLEAPMQNIIYLTDNQTGVQHNLSENPVYSFTSNEGDNPNRFLIHFGALSLDESSLTTAAHAYVHNSSLNVLNASGQTQVDIIDLQGRTLQSSSFRAEGLYSQPISLPTGVYVVRVMDEKGMRTAKVVVE